MSLKSHEVRKLAAAGTLALAMLGSASTAQAGDLTLNESCTYPLIGAQPLSFAVNATIPDSIAQGSASGQFLIKATATASGNTPSGLNILGAKTIEGTASASAQMSGASNLALNVPITIPKQSIPGTNANVTILANGQLPNLSFPNTGQVQIAVNKLSLNMTARDANGNAIPLQQPGATDSDGNPDTFDVACTPNPSNQNNVLKTFTITDRGTENSPTPASVQPAAPKAAPAVGDSTTIVNYGYNLSGGATLKNLISGGLPLTGAIKAKVSLPSGQFSGDLSLNPASGNLRALGVLPIQAKVAIVPTAPATGTLANGVLNATAKVGIHLTSATLAGIPLISGANCRSYTDSIIQLKSTDRFFMPLSGGTLAGSFAIGDLVGCGPLNGLV
ncbi:MAG: hypothetical protein REI11_18445, partial [Patulibacter sp.]|nr:hypothetical protein [Patulibacter sp.]